MIQPKRYNRSSSTMSISIFYEQYQLNKFNFSPSYQRESGIWKEQNQSFLIDSIFKNFPVPPVFLEQKIQNGITTYDVIDGKQRLTSIIRFIEDEISLPCTFSDDEYGYNPLNGKKISEIVELSAKDKIAEMFLDIFWSYKICVEYIEKPDANIVKGIFDRLNRNGERLNPAELRRAKYSDTKIFKAITEISNSPEANQIYNSYKDKRQRGLNFWTEVFIFVHENKIVSGNAKTIENKMQSLSMSEDYSIENLKNKVQQVISVVLKWNIDIKKYDISKETHVYVLLYMANYILQNNISVNDLATKLDKFYAKLRSNNFANDQNMITYFNTTQSGSKSASAREARFEAIKNALNI